MTQYIIREELLEGDLSCLSHLFKEHWEESTENKLPLVLAPDFSKYRALKEAGCLVTLFAYADDEVVGYSWNFLYPHLHHSKSICGYNDILFVRPAYRQSPLGMRLIKETERVIKEKGGTFMFWYAKEGTKLAKILRRSCGEHDITFTKEL
jgi:predicted GNAT superfamily acetyltransferase